MTRSPSNIKITDHRSSSIFRLG